MAKPELYTENKTEKEYFSKFKKIMSSFFKVATAVLLCLILVLVCIDFFDTTKGYLSYEIIIALCLVLIITCLDSFDCFQLGNILRLEKEKKSIKEDNNRLREQNNMLCSMVSNINNNIYIDSSRVVPTDGKNESVEETRDRINTYEPNDESTGSKEKSILLNYISKNKFEDATIIWSPKIESYRFPQTQGCLFDLYIRCRSVEQFVEVKYLVPAFAGFDYIDMQLSAIKNYNKSNQRSAKYVLILCKETLEGDTKIARANRNKYEQLLSEYKQFIASGMMVVKIE